MVTSLRLALVSTLAALVVMACSAESHQATVFDDPSMLRDDGAAVYGVTLLRSHASDPSDLVAFIEANWFAMDAIAVEQGLMTSYEVLAAPAREQDAWNVMVIVGFPTPGGYDDIALEFNAIREAHEPVAVNGMTQLSDFGRFMGSQTLATLPTIGQRPGD